MNGLAAGLLLLALTACGGTGGGLTQADAQALPQRSVFPIAPSVPDSLTSLPAPAMLPADRLANYSLSDIQRAGVQFEPAFPQANVSTSGGALVLSPLGGPALSDSAFAVYAFRLSGYDREPVLSLDFSVAPAEDSRLWLGLSNWASGNWGWSAYDGSGVLNLADLAPYTGPDPDKLMYLCVLLQGSSTAELSTVQLGLDLPSDRIFPLPAKNTAEPGERVRVTIWSSGTLNRFYGMEAVRIVLPQYNSYVTGSFNAGAPGGTVDAPDGIWAQVAPDSLDYPDDSEIVAQPFSAGLIAYDFYLRPSGGTEVQNAEGELFSFEVEVYTSINFQIPSQDPDDLTPLTFYINEAGEAHHWEGQGGGPGVPHIQLEGNALPTASIQADTLAGPLNLEVNFDASASTDVLPGSVAKYEFDFEGSGSFVDNGTDPLASYTYVSPGLFEATVRVTDNEGGQDTANINIYAGYFDEIEDNDDLGPSQDLGALPVNGFRGSIGPDGVYDGDVQDWFKSSAPANKNIVCRLELEQPFSNIQIELQSAVRGHLAWSSVDAEGHQELVYNVKPGDLQPLRVIVRSMTPELESSIYTLSVQSSPPSAALSATPPVGPVPLDVLLDASASTDSGGSIVQYEFDFGEGGGFIDNGNDPTANHSYNTEGVFTARVRVTDNEGNIDIASALVAPGLDYDEVEHNDTRQTANTIASLPVSGFSGSIGTRSGYISYDGDDGDWYSFAATTGDALQINCAFDPALSDLVVVLYNKDGVFINQSAADSKSPQQIIHTVASGQSPLKLLVSRISGGGDYSLDIKLNPPSAELQADVTQGDPPLNVNFNAGSSTDKAPGMIVKYEFDFGKGGGWEDYGLTSTAMSTYDADGAYAARVRVTDNDGLQDTALLSIKVGNPYDEQENNDDQLQANSVSLPLANWAGSLGDMPPGYVGYDGDDRDYIKFTATAGQSLSFDLSGDSENADIDIHLLNESGDILAESTSAEAVEHIDYSFTLDGTYYMYIELWYQITQEGFSDYLCSATLE